MASFASGNTYGTGIAANQAEATSLLDQARSESASKDKQKIEKAGKDFESILLGSWLQGAESSFAAAPGGDGDDDEDGSREQFMGMAMQQLAATLVQSGGIGIGRMISEHLQAASNPTSPNAVAGERAAKAGT